MLMLLAIVKENCVLLLLTQGFYMPTVEKEGPLRSRIKYTYSM